MTSKPECTSGAAPLAGAIRPDEKTGPGGSAPAPVPAGDARSLIGEGAGLSQRLKILADTYACQHAGGEPIPVRHPTRDELFALIDHVCIGLDSPPTALSNQVPAGDAVALAAECKRLAVDLIDETDEMVPIYGRIDDIRVRLYAAIDRLAALSLEGQADSTGGTTT